MLPAYPLDWDGLIPSSTTIGWCCFHFPAYLCPSLVLVPHNVWDRPQCVGLVPVAGTSPHVWDLVQ
jgi:hypothetical protein